jgi:hypothetical protein
MIVFAMIAIGVLVVMLVLAFALRRVTLDEGKTEERLKRPESHALTYAVPEGQDPAVLTAALAREGFTSVAELEGGVEMLLVECRHESDRATVRSIIEHVSRTGFDGAEMHVEHVSFEDER